MELLQKGKWVADKGALKHCESVGFHLSSLYSPWLTWGEVAEMFLKAEKTRNQTGDLMPLQNFTNGWLAQPWKAVIEKPKEEKIKKRVGQLPRFMAPEDAVAITAGVDVQNNGFYYSVWAWNKHLGAHLIDYDFITTWEEVENLCFNSEYKKENSEHTMRMWRVAIDTGGGAQDEGWSKTAEIYEWIRKNGRGIVHGVKGMSRKSAMGLKVSFSEIDKYPGKFGKKLPGKLILWSLDTDYFKEWLFQRFEYTDLDAQAIHLHNETKRDFIVQLLSEEKQRDKHGNISWVQVRRENHYLDCCVYASACVDPSWAGGLQYVTQGPKPFKGTPRAQAKKEMKTWLPPKNNWFR
jgi:phage terminase large subunit GpA-like protein